MSKPLKDENDVRLLAVLAANLVIFLAMLKAGSFQIAGFQDLADQVRDLIPAALAVALLTVANGLIGAQTKARLVFWRWSDPLPGCRAFSEHARSDSRIDLGALERKLGGLPQEAREQNATWYRLYQTLRSEPAVTQSHRDYLFARDYACLAAMFLIALGPLALYQFGNGYRGVVYIGFLVAQYLIVRHAATIYGCRFVTTVLAMKAAEE